MNIASDMRAASACTLLRRAGLLAVLCLGLALGACGGKKAVAPDRGGPWVAPQEPAQVFVSRLKPASQDLNSWTEMAPTIRKSESYCARKPASALAVNRGEMKITWGEMAETLRTLRGILPKLDGNPGLLLEKFRWIPFPGGIKYSSYYEPQIKASRERNPARGHTEPMYKVPPDLASYKAAHGGRYYSRREIDEGHLLEGKGLELAWADPVDVFFLQIQGSGKLIFSDGTEAFINYAGQNGHKYRSSGKIMAAKGGILKRGDIFEQRAWLHAHPERQKEIFNENPSYVFFKFGMRGSMGAMGYQVDDWLSLATDPRYIPLGAVVAFGVNAPDPQTGRFPLRGIGFAQDTGGAIKKDRIDIYAGGSDRGNYVASFLDASGPAWVLVRR